MKILKITGIVLATVIGLLIAAAIILSLVFDPNQYKPEVIKLVKDKTGRDLKIDKKIGWSFFPRLGIEAGGVELANAPGFGKEPFARIDAAGVHVAVLPLLTGRIEVGSLYLHGLELNLAKDASGRSNWDDLAAKKDKKPAAEPKPEKKADGKLPLEALAIGKLDIQRSTITWRDAGNLMAVRNLSLTTSRFVAGEPMDLKLAFELNRAQAAPVRAALGARLTASSDALKLANVDLKVDDSRLTGGIDIHNFTSPALRFDLALDKIDLDRYLGSPSDADKKPAEARTKSAAGDKPTEIPLTTLRSLNVDGKFRIDQLKAFGLKSSEAKIALTAKNGLITLGPNSAKLYSGNYRGTTTLDARGQTLQLGMNEKLDQVQLGPLLKDMDLFDSYSGAGNVELKLTANGFNAKQVTRSLNGNAAVSIKDGRIDGVNLGKFVKTLSAKGDALTKITKLVPEKGDHTVFGQMNATFQISNGVARNRDLIVRAAEFSATGKGEANLVSEKLDYRLQLAEIGNEGKKCKTLPVRVEGPFAGLNYLPDMEEILKCQATKQVEKQLEKGLENLLAPKKKKK